MLGACGCSAPVKGGTPWRARTSSRGSIEAWGFRTADGQHLGKVTAVWLGTDPTAANPRCDEELCSRLEVHHGFLGHRVLYVPYSAIADVVADQVTLNVDAATVQERAWTQKP